MVNLLSEFAEAILDDEMGELSMLAPNQPS